MPRPARGDDPTFDDSDSGGDVDSSFDGDSGGDNYHTELENAAGSTAFSFEQIGLRSSQTSLVLGLVPPSREENRQSTRIWAIPSQCLTHEIGSYWERMYKQIPELKGRIEQSKRQLE